ncbi:MAG: enoyl-CoA hydratase/isomerase family protein [Acidimicrobiales bacterium]|nr:enoyl-CoA hydratase/isomerase family protein [Acidimicrobiales bacterium]
MRIAHWSADEARAVMAGGSLDQEVGAAHGVAAVVVELSDSDAGADIAAALTALPVIAVAPGAPVDAGWDVTPDDPAEVLEGVLAAPLAAVTTTQVLRRSPTTDAADGLLVESLAYATLQAGPEFAAWLAGRGRRVRTDDSPRLSVESRADTTVITLSRSKLRNMMDARMRTELVEALRTAALSEGPIVLAGDGPAFCAGGDLAEFGAVSDPATAHQIRSSANVAPWLLRVADRTTAHVHGACVGAGVELAAFCGTVIAEEDARFRLPETRMGLMPGAGGTVSVPGRIGRARTLEWLLTGHEIDVGTARDWGLVDRIR